MKYYLLQSVLTGKCYILLAASAFSAVDSFNNLFKHDNVNHLLNGSKKAVSEAVKGYSVQWLHN
jgi:hypothetical protein